MYKVIVISLFASSFLFGQMNPDGYVGGFSLHITPLVTFGTATQTIEGLPGNTNDLFKADTEYLDKLGIILRAVVPLSQQVSLSLLYSYRSTDQRFNYKSSPDIFLNTKGSIKTIAATISIYIK